MVIVHSYVNVYQRQRVIGMIISKIWGWVEDHSVALSDHPGIADNNEHHPVRNRGFLK